MHCQVQARLCPLPVNIDILRGTVGRVTCIFKFKYFISMVIDGVLNQMTI